MEEALVDVPRYREFVGLGSRTRALPDEGTILRFRHLLEKHKGAAQIWPKGSQWYFGMKVHIGVDAGSGWFIGTSGNVNDVVEANSLLPGEERDAFGDAGYQGVDKRMPPQTRANPGLLPS